MAPSARAAAAFSSPVITCTGMCRVSRVVLQAVENCPAGHVGQSDVERDRAGPELAGQRQGRAPRSATSAFRSALVRHIHAGCGRTSRRPPRSAGPGRRLDAVAIVVDRNVLVDQRGGSAPWQPIGGNRNAHGFVRRRHALTSRCGIGSVSACATCTDEM